MPIRQKNIAPICDRLVKLIDKRRGKRKIAEYMRDVGLNASDYHNLKKSTPAADKLVDILKACKASPVEIFSVLGYDNDFLEIQSNSSENIYRSILNQVVETAINALTNRKQMSNESYQSLLQDILKDLEGRGTSKEELRKMLALTKQDFDDFLSGKILLDVIHLAKIARLNIQKANGLVWTLEDIYRAREAEKTHYHADTDNARENHNGSTNNLNCHSG
ncbi:MAG: hypothetical protein AAGA60_31790 [Cyanobacteria bacterium P01_E01_bin.42]